MPTNDTINPADRHSATLKLAYYLWEQAGRPFGQDQHFWDVAQQQMATDDAGETSPQDDDSEVYAVRM